MAERAPWFSAQERPPVNGHGSAKYEWRCRAKMSGPSLLVKSAVIARGRYCRHCQWRGLTEP
jgi:hypothetical protein